MLGLISDDGCSTILGFFLLVGRTGFGEPYRLWWAVQAEGTRESVRRKSHNSTWTGSTEISVEGKVFRQKVHMRTIRAQFPQNLCLLTPGVWLYFL